MGRSNASTLPTLEPSLSSSLEAHHLERVLTTFKPTRGRRPDLATWSKGNSGVRQTCEQARLAQPAPPSIDMGILGPASLTGEQDTP